LADIVVQTYRNRPGVTSCLNATVSPKGTLIVGLIFGAFGVVILEGSAFCT
jgi:hypothetical protein